MELQITNPNIIDNNRTNISQPAYAGATNINVYDTAGFNQYDYYVLDAPSTNKAEMVQIMAVVNTTTLTVSALTETHMQGAVVQNTPFNQIQIFRSTTGISGSFSLLTTIGFAWDQQYTPYTDLTGQSSYAYYSVAYNSQNSLQGATSSIITGSGFDANSFFMIKKRARDLLKDYYSSFMDDTEMGIYVNEKYNKMQQIAMKVDKEFNVETSPTITIVSSTQEYLLPSDFVEALFVRVTKNGSNYFPAMYKKYQDVKSLQYQPFINNPNIVMTYNNLPWEMYYFKANNIGFYPFFDGTCIIDYYCTAASMVADSDIPILPLNNFSYMMVNYAVKRGYLKSGRADLVRVQEMEKQEQVEDAAFISFMQQRQVQFNQAVELTDSSYLAAQDLDMEDSFYW